MVFAYRITYPKAVQLANDIYDEQQREDLKTDYQNYDESDKEFLIEEVIGDVWMYLRGDTEFDVRRFSQDFDPEHLEDPGILFAFASSISIKEKDKGDFFYDVSRPDLKMAKIREIEKLLGVDGDPEWMAPDQAQISPSFCIDILE